MKSTGNPGGLPCNHVAAVGLPHHDQARVHPGVAGAGTSMPRSTRFSTR